MRKGTKMSETSKQKIKDARARQTYFGSRNKGKKASPELKLKLRQSARRGKNHHNWKETGVGYYSIHNWIERWKGKPKKCERCGTETAKKYEWANIDHKYRRVLEDFIRMCTKCHRCYDRDVLKIKVGRYQSV